MDRKDLIYHCEEPKNFLVGSRCDVKCKGNRSLEGMNQIMCEDLNGIPSWSSIGHKCTGYSWLL